MEKIFKNEQVNPTINFLIEVLFLADIWIIFYNNLLTFLNFVYPPIVNVLFYRPAVAAREPFEMPLYLLLSFVFVLGLFLLKKVHLKFEFPLLIKLIFLLLLIILFETKLGTFPLAHEFYPYSPRPDQFIYTTSLLLYLAAIGVIIIQMSILKNIFKAKKALPGVLFLIVGLIIAAFIFEPRFHVSPLEYAFFYGPIWEIVKGKTIFTDIPSQYGFLSILFFSLLFKLKLFAFSHLAIWNWIFHIIQYFICYYLIYKTSKSVSLGLIGLFSIITLNYYSFYVPVLTIVQYGALRRLTFFLALLLFYKFKKIDSPFFIFIYSLMSFWIVDSGIQMILAYGLTLFYLFLAKNISFKRLLRCALLLFASLTGIFMTINFFHLIFGWKTINAFEIISTLRQYAISGVGMIPIDSHTYFWIILLLYFASVIYFFRNNFFKSNILHSTSDILILFSANISLFASLYFVGRSDNSSLIIISIFPLLNLFLLIATNYNPLIANKFKILFNVFLFIVFIVFPAYERRYTLTELLLEKYHSFLSGNIFHTELEENLEKRFAREKSLINSQMPDKEALILSSDDTYLLYLTNKKNLLDENPQSGIESDFEMKSAVKTVVKTCPKKIAVDCNIMGKCSPFTPFTKGWITAGYILKEVESGCRIHYQSTICTNQICIAQSR